MIKKLFIGLLTGAMVVGGSMSMVSASNGGGFTNQDSGYRPDVPGVGNQPDTTHLLTGIQNIINFVLGILSLIALIILLWGGFQMVTAAGNEEKYKKGFTILKQAGIGLILIGFSWLIISFIFSLVGNSATV